MDDSVFQIIEGHDGGACFWILPVRCHSEKCFGWDAVEECDTAEISLDEDDVYGCLRYFFEKYFDTNLIYNQQRKADWSELVGYCEKATFQWYLTHNFYTYDCVRQMLSEIDSVCDQLKNVGIDAISAGVIEASVLEQNDVTAIADYYERFSRRMKQMLDENHEWPLISIMGP